MELQNFFAARGGKIVRFLIKYEFFYSSNEACDLNIWDTFLNGFP